MAKLAPPAHLLRALPCRCSKMHGAGTALRGPSRPGSAAIRRLADRRSTSASKSNNKSAAGDAWLDGEVAPNMPGGCSARDADVRFRGSAWRPGSFCCPSRSSRSRAPRGHGTSRSGRSRRAATATYRYRAKLWSARGRRDRSVFEGVAVSVPEFGLSKHEKKRAAGWLLFFGLGTVFGFIALALVIHQTAATFCGAAR